MKQGTQSQCSESLEGCGECEGGSGEREHMYAYGRFMLMCGKIHHDIR